MIKTVLIFISSLLLAACFPRPICCVLPPDMKIREALYDNDAARIEMLILTKEVNANKEIDGQTLLHWLITSKVKNKAELAKFLIKHGANVNAVSAKSLYTPLETTVINDCICSDLIKVLLENGADVNTNVGGMTPLMRYVLNTINLYELNGDKNLEAKKEERLSLIQEKIDGIKDVLEILISHGANMNIKYKDGKTALQVSEELLGYFQQENPDLAKKYTEIVELLRSKGAS